MGFVILEYPTFLGGALRGSAEELQPEDHPTDRNPASGENRVRPQQEPHLP